MQCPNERQLWYSTGRARKDGGIQPHIQRQPLRSASNQEHGAQDGQTGHGAAVCTSVHTGRVSREGKHSVGCRGKVCRWFHGLNAGLAPTENREPSHGIHLTERQTICTHQKGCQNPGWTPRQTFSHPGFQLHRVPEPFSGTMWQRWKQLCEMRVNDLLSLTARLQDEIHRLKCVLRAEEKKVLLQKKAQDLWQHVSPHCQPEDKNLNEKERMEASPCPLCSPRCLHTIGMRLWGWNACLWTITAHLHYRNQQNQN